MRIERRSVKVKGWVYVGKIIRVVSVRRASVSSGWSSSGVHHLAYLLVGGRSRRTEGRLPMGRLRTVVSRLQMHSRRTWSLRWKVLSPPGIGEDRCGEYEEFRQQQEYELQVS